MVKDIGLEALRKVGTIIRTEIRVRLGQIIPTSVDRRPNFCVDLLYSHWLSPVCVVNQDHAFHNH